MHTVSARVSADAARHRSLDSLRSQWPNSHKFPKSADRVEQPEQTIALPFDPEERGRSEINDALRNISSFQNAEKERIYRHAKQFYTSEIEKIAPEDVVDICQIIQFSQKNNHKDWIEPLESEITSFFSDIEENSVFLRQADQTELDDIGIDEIRDALEQRRDSMNKATEAVYGSPDEEPNKSVIDGTQKAYLWMLLQNSNDFSNLPL